MGSTPWNISELPYQKVIQWLISYAGSHWVITIQESWNWAKFARVRLLIDINIHLNILLHFPCLMARKSRLKSGAKDFIDSAIYVIFLVICWRCVLKFINLKTKFIKTLHRNYNNKLKISSFQNIILSINVFVKNYVNDMEEFKDSDY